MSEQQLADVLIQIGLDRGLTIERVVDELATIRLPSYVDQGRFRAVIVSGAEARLRAQFEERLNRLRQQYGVGAGAGDAVAPIPPAPMTPPPAMPAPAMPAAPEPAPPMPIGQGRVRLEPGADDLTTPPTRVPDQATQFQPSPADPRQAPAAQPRDQAMPRDATIFWANKDGGEPR